MKLIGKGALNDFKRSYPDAGSQIDALQAEIGEAEWNTPLDLKKRYVTASILPKNHVVFNIKGNKYRVLAQVSYQGKIVLIKKAGTHAEYDSW